MKDPLDQKDKRDKKGRGCLVSNLCGGAGQVAVEMHRLYIQVGAFEDVNNKDMTLIENWVRHFRHYGDLDSVLTCILVFLFLGRILAWFYLPSPKSVYFGFSKFSSYVYISATVYGPISVINYCTMVLLKRIQ